MLSSKPFRLLLPQLRWYAPRPLPGHHDARPSLRCHDRANRRRRQEAPTYNITNHVFVNIGEAAKQPVDWDAVAISPEAKALLQQHAVKASTALKMHRILGFEDVDDVQRLTPDLIAQLNLQPLQLGPLLAMLQQPQPGADGLHQARKQQPATSLKLLVHSDMGYKAISPDGRTALVTNATDDLEAWDLATGARIAVMAGHERGIFSVAITPDGSKAVSGGYDTTLRVWDLATYRCIAKLEGHTSTVRSVAVTPDGRHAVSGSMDKTLRVWDLATRRCTATMRGHTDWVWSVAVTPDGRTVVSGGDKTVRLWDLATHACTATLHGHTDTVTCVALTPDGRHAVSGSEDPMLRLWDLAAHTCIATMEGHPHGVRFVLITPDGRYAVSTPLTQSTPRVWDLSTYINTASAAAAQQ